jgi:hypothetical protein
MSNILQNLFLLLTHLTWHFLDCAERIGKWFYNHVLGFHYIVDIPLFFLKRALHVLVFLLEAASDL